MTIGEQTKISKGTIGGIALAIIIVIAVIVVVFCSVRVPAGYVAVQYKMNGGVIDDVLTQGWHIVSPTTTTTLYTVGIEQSYLTSGEDGDSNKDESFEASSSEGKAVTIDLTFTYQYQADDVADVFTTFKGQSGKEVRDSFIKPNIISWSKEIIAQYSVSDIVGAERAAINQSLTDYLSEKFKPYGITISNVSLINVDVDDETMEAISAKITAQQAAETQGINNQTNIDKAEAEAQVKITQAQADADAMMIEAEAEAEANAVIADSLTPELIEKMQIDQWNGVLPMIQGSGSTNTILDISNFLETEEEDIEE